MATEASDSVFVSSFHPTEMDLTGIAGYAINWIMRIIMFMLYAFLFIFTLVTLGFIEIRQANMSTFNSLIATLEQRDAYRFAQQNPVTNFENQLDIIAKDRTEYEALLKSKLLDCSEGTETNLKQFGSANLSSPNAAANANLENTCQKIRDGVREHLYQLFSTEDDLLSKIATLEPYYSQYADGITQQSPQIIPALRFLDWQGRGHRWVTALARSSFEITEMLLLVCMGMLGGVINVTRCFIERSLVTPSIPDLIYKPAMGAVVALGIYVLFRASQLFFAGQSSTGAIASTSIFLLAGLGLASGVCANDAIAQIEALAKRMLRRSPDDREGNKPAADPPGPGGDATPAGPAPSAS